MRSSGAVYRKLKEAKYYHWRLLCRKLFRRTSANCKYCHPYAFIGSDGKKYAVRLCLIHQDIDNVKKGIFPNLIDVCNESENCRCDGFAYRYTKEEAKKIFEDELNTTAVKEKKYPDICALEWVLERHAFGIPPFNKIQMAYYNIKRLTHRDRDKN